MMHKEVEVYVDDMITKNKEEEDHINVLRKLFKRLQKFQLKLNPEKCTFRVTSGKLLGFIVSQQGIEIDPEKVKAIVNLPPPKTFKEDFITNSPFVHFDCPFMIHAFCSGNLTSTSVENERAGQGIRFPIVQEIKEKKIKEKSNQRK